MNERIEIVVVKKGDKEAKRSLSDLSREMLKVDNSVKKMSSGIGKAFGKVIGTNKRMLAEFKKINSGSLGGLKEISNQIFILNKNMSMMARKTSTSTSVLRKINARLRITGKEANVAGRGMRNLSNNARRAGNSMNLFGRLAQRALIYFSIYNFARIVDSWTEFENKIRLATRSQEEFTRVSDRLFKIAQQTRTGIDATATSYVRLKKAIEEVGGTTEDTLKLVELLNKASIASGASSAEAARAMTQFLQGVSKGKADMRDFRSIMEQMPLFADALAEAAGMSKQELLEFVTEGKASAEFLVQTTFKAAEAIDRNFNKTNKTIGQAFTQLSNRFKRFIGQTDKQHGIVKLLIRGLDLLTEQFDNVAIAITVILALKFASKLMDWTSAIGLMIPKVIALVKGLNTIPTSMAGVKASFAAGTLQMQLFLATMVAIASFEFGRFLFDRFAVVREMSASLVIGFQKIWHQVKGFFLAGVKVLENAGRQLAAGLIRGLADGLQKIFMEFPDLALLIRRLTDDAVKPFKIIRRLQTEAATIDVGHVFDGVLPILDKMNKEVEFLDKVLNDLFTDEIGGERVKNKKGFFGDLIDFAIKDIQKLKDAILGINKLDPLSEAAGEGTTGALGGKKSFFDMIQEGAEKGFSGFKNSIATVTDSTAKLVEDMFNKMTDAIVGFTETGKFEFEGFARSIVRNLLKIQTQTLLVQLLTSAKGSGSGILSGIGSFFLGGIKGSQFGNALNAGEPSMVGETQPELFIPSTSGRVANQNQTGSSDSKQEIRIVNVTQNPEDFLNSPAGTKTIVNIMSENAQTLRGIVAT